MEYSHTYIFHLHPHSHLHNKTSEIVCLNTNILNIQPIEAAFISLGMIYLLYHIRNSQSNAKIIDDNNNISNETFLIYPLYYTFMKIACILMFLRAILVLLSSFTVIFNIGEILIAGPIGSTMEETVSFFLAQKSSGEGAIRRAKYFAIIRFLIQFIVGIICIFLLGDAKGHFSTKSLYNSIDMYWLVSDCLKAVVVFGCLLYMLFRDASTQRYANYYYSAFIISLYGMSVLIQLQLISDDSDCAIFITFCFYDLLWPLVLFYTLQVDSQYWREILSLKSTSVKDDGDSRGKSHSLPLLKNSFDELNEFPQESILSFEKLRFGRQIGSGGTSVVYRGQYNSENVAIKSFRCEMLTKEYVERFAKEMALCVRLDSKYVVKFNGLCVVPPSICIVTEFMERGSLFRVLTVDAPYLTYRQRLIFASDAANGVAFLHSLTPKVIHRDIKSLNFLVDAKYNVKLADLGEAREINAPGSKHMTVNRGTPHWMSPEAFCGSDYDEKTDVYSLGIVMWEIITSKRPFEDISAWMIPAAVVEKNLRPTCPSWVPNDYVALIRTCWDANPRIRPSAAEVVSQLAILISGSPTDGSWPGLKTAQAASSHITKAA